MLVAINARDDAQTFQAFRHDAPSGSEEKQFTNDQLALLLDQLRQKHDPIAEDIANDAGIRLMNQDSQMAEIVIDHFTRQDIPVLCVHDSFIVPLGYEAELQHVMDEAFARVTGIKGARVKQDSYNPFQALPVDVGGATLPGLYKAVIEELAKRKDTQRSERYNHDLQAFQDWRGSAGLTAPDRSAWDARVEQELSATIRAWTSVDD